MINEYKTEVQKLFLEMMLHDSELYVRVSNIFNPENFDRSLRKAAEFIHEYAKKYSVLPELKIVNTSVGSDLEELPELSQEHNDFFLNEFESFTKRKELERAILTSADLLEKGEFGQVERLIKDAVQISLQKDMGTDYFADPKSRLNRYFNSGGQVSTGWPQLDKLLFGGWSRQELNLFAGGSGSGKSVVKMNLAVNLLQQGLNGVYITLELSEELTSLRTDAMLTQMSTRDIRKDMDTVELKVKMNAKKMGQYRIKSLPAQSNVNHIRSYLKELQIKTGIKVDFVIIDYLDLLLPAGAKIGPESLFVKDKYVSEELRNLAKELGVIMISSSQLNRSAVEEIEFDHSMIAGGLSKVQSSDNVFGIFTSRSMRERGKYQIQCMKSRSSTGVGQKIDLDYDINTMRITDPGVDGQTNNQPQQSPSSILQNLKPSSTMVSNSTGEIDTYEPQGKVVADVRSSQLRSLLNKLKN